MKIRLALLLAATVCLALLASRPAGADYSDHGDPATSEVTPQSTHPGQPSGPGLARTGVDARGLTIAAVVLVAGGAVLLLATTKRSTR